MRRRLWPLALLILALSGAPVRMTVLRWKLAAAAPAANPHVLSLAARAAECAKRQGLLSTFQHLAVIDYSLPSTQPACGYSTWRAPPAVPGTGRARSQYR